ncbi:unnamed protein product [Urochloa humidicola]
MDAYGVTMHVFVPAATLVATVVMGMDRETRNIQITLADTLSPLQVPVTAMWSYTSAFVYGGLEPAAVLVEKDGAMEEGEREKKKRGNDMRG